MQWSNTRAAIRTVQATFSLFLVLTLTQLATAAGTFGVTLLTDDASTGISTSTSYTHTISGGSAATVNSVNFDALTSGATPANFTWDTHGSSKNQIGCCNNGDWNPAAGGVTGPGLINMLGSFSFSGNGAGSPAQQTYTLSGLTPGTDYIAKLFVRVWDTDGSGRPLDITFTNGTDVDPLGTVPEDRPTLAAGAANDHGAYYLSYAYTAQGTELSINAAVAAIGGGNSGSAHMYALSNEGGTPPPPPPPGPVTLGFGAQPGGVPDTPTDGNSDQSRENVDDTFTDTPGAGTYSGTTWEYTAAQTGQVWPYIAKLTADNTYEILAVGDLVTVTTPGTVTDVTFGGSDTFDLDGNTTIFAGIVNPAGSGSQNPIATTVNNGNSTDHNNNNEGELFAPPTVGKTVSGFGFINLNRSYHFAIDVEPIPEPSTIMLGVISMLCLAACRLRRNKNR